MTERSWLPSYPRLCRCRAAGWMLAASMIAPCAADSRLLIESGPGQAAAIEWRAASLSVLPGEPGSPTGWEARFEGLSGGGLNGSVRVTCRDGGLSGGRPWCGDGHFEWRPESGAEALTGRLYHPGSGTIGLKLLDGGIDLVATWPTAEAPLAATLRLDGLELDALPRGLAQRIGLSALAGRIDGSLRWQDGILSAELRPEGLEFDRADGLVAGAGVAARVRFELGPFDDQAGWPFLLSLSQQAGELLVGPVYLPPPEAPLSISASGRFRPAADLQVDSLSLADGDLLTLDGGLTLAAGTEGWTLSSVSVEALRLELPAAWERWGEGVAGSYGLGGLETAGSISAALHWESGVAPSLSLEAEDLAVTDARGRFALDDVDARVRRDASQGRISLDWAALEIFRLSFGASSLRAVAADGQWSLVEALVLPLLDGAVVFDRLELAEAGEGPLAVGLDARIEPLDLASLTRMLGLPEFGGSLSGRFPGVELEGERLAFTGGIDVSAFDGRIGLTELVVERPFGSLPALAAQVELERLDLESLTGAFNFGHMEGELSGWMRGLRLLDWQPVAMDARMFTHEDASSRRISQRAVENLSRLGGGAAALSAPLLGLFEEFPYRRAGLACRLDRNICHMDGVAPHDSGGYYIVEGRGLPRLDVIGHRRLVDWPRLVAQLVAIARQSD